MAALIEWISGIFTTIGNIATLLVNTAKSLLTLLLYLPNYLSTLSGAISYIPAIYQGIIAAAIGISVIFLITGRGK